MLKYEPFCIKGLPSMVKVYSENEQDKFFCKHASEKQKGQAICFRNNSNMYIKV